MVLNTVERPDRRLRSAIGGVGSSWVGFCMLGCALWYHNMRRMVMSVGGGRKTIQWRLWSGSNLGAPVQGMFDRGYDDGRGKLARMRVSVDWLID